MTQLSGRRSAAVLGLLMVVLSGSVVDLLAPHAAGAGVMPASRLVVEGGVNVSEMIAVEAEARAANDRERSGGVSAFVEPKQDLAAPGADPAAAVPEPEAIASAPPRLLVPVGPLTVDVWGAEERYFAIVGTTPDELIASAKASVPTDPSGATRHSMAYAGPIVWQHEPSYVIDQASATCTMTGVSSAVRYQATVPQWTSPRPVPAELLAWWTAMLEHIRQHEGEHVRIFGDFVSQLPARVTGQPCDSWDAIVNRWSADVAGAQAAFDAAEASWAGPPYTGPLDW